ncbi:MAG: DUF1573 domain-containing protein [Bacteroidales bacterium]
MKYSLITFALMSIIIGYSCDSSGSDKDNDDSMESYIDDGREKHATISFEEDFFDFGTVKHGEVLSYTFLFTNTGNIPLIINDVVAGCGCTTTKLTKEVLKPNQQASIEVVFNTRGWHGSQYKNVTIVSNAQTSKRSITIKANVVS